MSEGFWRLIEDAASRSSFRPSLVFWRQVWPVLVGEDIGRRSSPCGWHGETLIVEVETGAWMAALEKARPKLLRELGRLPWPVKELELLPGFVGDRPKASNHRDLASVELPAEAKAILADDDLDDEIAALAGKIRLHLEWEKKMTDDG